MDLSNEELSKKFYHPREWSIKSIVERIKDWEEEYTELETDNILNAIKTYITGDLSFQLFIKLLKEGEKIASELELILSVIAEIFLQLFQRLEGFTKTKKPQ